MVTKIFIGKLSFDTSEKTLVELFGKYGEVVSVAIIMDRATNQSKGFAFVEMNNLKAAQTAIKELDGTDVDGRTIVVNAAKERDDKPRRSAGVQRNW
jgi:RNA recognition motif-containing protein